MTRYLSLDYGEKRVGIAVSDPFNSMALPLAFIPNNDALIANIVLLAEDYSISNIVLGLPKHTQAGKETDKEKEVREFATRLEAQARLPIAFWDERFSTAAMTKQFKAHDISRKKRKNIIDSSAAAFILQGYLDKLNLGR